MTSLQKYFSLDPSTLEIGVDEVGRGPLLGRVYAAAVILPKDDTFDHGKMKDSKKFHSKKKITDVSKYIKEKALLWSIQWVDESTIDQINILQASQMAMHQCIQDILQHNPDTEKNPVLLIDGNYFKPFLNHDSFQTLEHHCIEGGDNKYSSIAAASILAKVERDNYIDDLCQQHPHLITHYGIDSNKGYGSVQHIQGIQQHGITPWHRRTFGICRQFL